MITRRALIGSSVAAAGLLAAPGLVNASSLLVNAPRRFRHCSAGGPPCQWNWIKVIDKATGGELTMVTAANADEGWYDAYIDDDDGRPVYDGQEYAIRRFRGDIEIRLQEDTPESMARLVSTDDIEAGCLYDEDLSEDERSWLANGKPWCLCGRCPMPKPGMICGELCETNAARRMSVSYGMDGRTLRHDPT